MNINHKKLISNLIPVVWEPGHMGAFFGRFLFDDIYVREYHEGLPSQIKFLYSSDYNFEWRWCDRIGNYFSYLKDDVNSPLYKTVEILKKCYAGDSEVDLDSAVMYITAQHLNEVYEKSIITRVNHAYWLNKYNETELEHMVNKDFNFDFANFEFPYIKSHLLPNIYRINNLEWKKKVLCKFPPEKTWLVTILLFYKHYWYYKKDNIPIGKLSTFMNEDGERFLTVIENKNYFRYYPQNTMNRELDDFIIVDMFDLIFKNDTTNLDKIDSCFEHLLSETRLSLLNDAKNHIVNICNIFGLDPEMNIPIRDDSSKMLSPQVIEACNYIKNNRTT